MADATKVPSLRVSRIKPQRVSDVGYADQRGDGYGDAYVSQQGLNRMASEGSIFVARNATQGTGIAQTANTSADTTKPFILGILPSTSLVSLHLLRLVLIPTAVSSSQSSQNFDVVVSTGPTRSSAGTDYNAKASGIATAGYHNARSDSPFASALSALWVGVPVAVLGSDPWQAVRWPARTGAIAVVKERYTMNFGGFSGGYLGGRGAAHTESTTVNDYQEDFPPVVIEPGGGFEVIPWAASVAGAMSWEFELIWQER